MSALCKTIGATLRVDNDFLGRVALIKLDGKSEVLARFDATCELTLGFGAAG